MEQLDDNLLFRWFVVLSMDAPVWDVTVFTKNWERLLTGDVAATFLATTLGLSVLGALRSFACTALRGLSFRGSPTPRPGHGRAEE